MCGGGFALLCGQFHLFTRRLGAFVTERRSCSRIISAQAGPGQDAYVGPRVAQIPLSGMIEPSRNTRKMSQRGKSEVLLLQVHLLVSGSWGKREDSSRISFSLTRWSFLYHSLSFLLVLAAFAAQNSYSAHFADAGLQGGNREEIVPKV